MLQGDIRVITRLVAAGRRLGTMYRCVGACSGTACTPPLAGACLSSRHRRSAASTTFLGQRRPGAVMANAMPTAGASSASPAGDELYLAAGRLREGLRVGGAIHDVAPPILCPWLPAQPRVFSARAAVDALVLSGVVPDRPAAVSLGTRLQKAWLLEHVQAGEAFSDSTSLWRFVADGPAALEALNGGFVWPRPARPASTVASELRQGALRLYGRFLSDDGAKLDYDGLRSSAEFRDLALGTSELARADIFELTREERIAFFVNTYNLLVIHATVVLGKPTSTIKLAAWFKRIRYVIGGQLYSADDIENGVLRGNLPGASSLAALLDTPALSQGPFGPADPRRYHVTLPPDPRIHYVLVCGAKSCPPIRVYSADNLEAGLDAAARNFLENETEVDSAARVVRLSAILKWYGRDFGATLPERLEYVARHLPEERAAELRALLATGPPPRVEYKKYDWDLNS